MNDESGASTPAARPTGQIIPLQVLDLWADAVGRWTAADPREAPPSTHLPDIAAHLIDAVRIGTLERRDEHEEAEEVARILYRLMEHEVPALLGQTQGRDHGRLLLAMTRLVMESPSVPPYTEGIAHARSTLQTLASLHPDAGEEVRTWMWRTGQGRHPRFRNVKALLLGTTPAPTPGVAPGRRTITTLGLFDGADAGALAESEQSRAHVRATLRRIVPAITDKFLVEVLVDERLISYVQGLIEDDGALFIEVGNPALLEMPGAPDRNADLSELGWNAPQQDLPNPWRLVERDEIDAAEVADVLVQAMEAAHDAFTDLPIDAVLSVSPPALAEIGLADDAVVVSVDFGDGGPPASVAEPNAANDPMPATVLELWADAIPRHLQRRMKRSLVIEAASVLIGAVTLRLRMRMAAGAEPEPDHLDLITRMTDLVLPATARPAPPLKRRLPPKKKSP